MISLIHPSRGRPEKSFKTIDKWKSMAGTNDVEVLVSLDKDDPLAIKYYGAYDKFNHPVHRVSIKERDNRSLVEATNAAVKQSKGDILVYVSDDFDCFPNWGQVLLNEFNKYPGVPIIIKVDDCLQAFNVPVLTIPIMNRMCHDALGYFFHPDFKSMHCDEHLYHRTKKLGFLKFAPHIKFEHRHVSVGKAEDDDTYRRSAANWNHGKETLAKHRRMGFTV
jgi:glycosyltransferase involved in cell wall biosynthesis